MWLGYRPGDRASSPDDLPGAAQRERLNDQIHAQVEAWLASPAKLTEQLLHWSCPWRLWERICLVTYVPETDMALIRDALIEFFNEPAAITRLGPEAERMLLTYLDARAAEVLRP